MFMWQLINQTNGVFPARDYNNVSDKSLRLGAR